MGIGTSVDYDRSLSEVSIIVNLPDEKISNIRAGYQSVSPTFGINQYLVPAGPLSICQNAWSDDCPVETTFSNEVLLNIFVVISAP